MGVGACHTTGRREGWPGRRRDAGHRHMLVDPAAVADALLDLIR